MNKSIRNKTNITGHVHSRLFRENCFDGGGFPTTDSGCQPPRATQGHSHSVKVIATPASSTLRFVPTPARSLVQAAADDLSSAGFTIHTSVSCQQITHYIYDHTLLFNSKSVLNVFLCKSRLFLY